LEKRTQSGRKTFPKKQASTTNNTTSPISPGEIRDVADFEVFMTNDFQRGQFVIWRWSRRYRMGFDLVFQ
jgi:hypothetical protein